MRGRAMPTIWPGRGSRPVHLEGWRGSAFVLFCFKRQPWETSINASVRRVAFLGRLQLGCWGACTINRVVADRALVGSLCVTAEHWRLSCAAVVACGRELESTCRMHPAMRLTSECVAYSVLENVRVVLE